MVATEVVDRVYQDSISRTYRLSDKKFVDAKYHTLSGKGGGLIFWINSKTNKLMAGVIAEIPGYYIYSEKGGTDYRLSGISVAKYTEIQTEPYVKIVVISGTYGRQANSPTIITSQRKRPRTRIPKEQFDKAVSAARINKDYPVGWPSTLSKIEDPTNVLLRKRATGDIRKDLDTLYNAVALENNLITIIESLSA